MTYSTASAADQKLVQNFQVQVRGVWVQALALGAEIQNLFNSWNFGDKSILSIAGSPNGTVIPDGNSLAGAQPLTDTELTNLYGVLAGMLNGGATPVFTPTNVAAATPAVGINTSGLVG